MGFRLTHRPGFTLRRFFHHLREDFRTWRANRDVADAFYDPLLDGPTLAERLRALRRKLPVLPRLTRPVPFTAFGAGIVILLGAAAVYFAVRMLGPADAAETAPLAGTPSAPGADIAVDPKGPKDPAGNGGNPAPKAGPAGEGTSVASLTALPEAEIPQPARLPERYHALVASKRDRTLLVYERQGRGEWRKVASFPMVYGRWAGDKADAGDRRTPEGRYWITSMRSGPSQGPLYGSLVFTLNYPTPQDIADGKSGEGIWIHGTEAGKAPSYTRGCLSISNDDMMKLADYADVGTPVAILPDSVGPDPAKQLDEIGMEREYPALIAAHGTADGRPATEPEKRKTALAEARAFLAKEAREHPGGPALADADKEAVLARLEKWRGDWSRRDTAAYEGNYAPGFKDRMGRSREDFLERKRRIFAVKRRIAMEMLKPEITVEGNGRVSVTFRQEYEAEGAEPGEGVQRSSGPKTVWLEQGPDGWFIVKE